MRYFSARFSRMQRSMFKLINLEKILIRLYQPIANVRKATISKVLTVHFQCFKGCVWQSPKWSLFACVPFKTKQTEYSRKEYIYTTIMLSHIYARLCTSRSSSSFRMSRALERKSEPEVNLTRVLSLSFYFIKILTSRKKNPNREEIISFSSPSQGVCGSLILIKNQQLSYYN